MTDIEAQYQKTLDYLYSFVDFSLVHSAQFDPSQFDLARVRQLAEKLGNPERAYPIIHVAGTKGKGSVSALCASALQAAHYRVGLYTSPHLEDYAERIQINGQPIPHADLVALVDELRPIIESIPRLSTFEITTLLAYEYFARSGVNAAVIEVGLGGRLDATNICLPIVSVITSLSYDHMQVLGNTLAQIAGEKAGIIKPGIPVVVSPQEVEAWMVVERVARQQGAPLYEVGKDYLFAPVSRSLDGQTFMIWSASEQPMIDAYIESAGNGAWQPTRLEIPLLGYHQVVNAATAYATLQVARAQGLAITESQIREGFRNATWPGRFEIIHRNPIIVLDSAHNRDAALKLRLALDDYFPGKPVILVFGASEDKDIQGMFFELLPRVNRVIVVKSFHPRAADPELLAKLVHQFGRQVSIIPDIADALPAAVKLAGHEAIVLVTGSIFVAAGARISWQKNWSSHEK